MPNALVTGATGFIGRRLCQLLAEAGWNVTATGREKSNGPWNEFIAFDLCSNEPFVFPKNTDHVFHLAGKAHALDELDQDPKSYDRCNAEGTRKVLEAAIAIGSKSFILFSSTKAMGEGNADYPTQSPIDESLPCFPKTTYGKSKLKAENITKEASNKLRTNIIRPCLVYGPKSKGNLTRMAEAISQNRFPPIPEFGNQRSVVHVDDLCLLAMSIANNSSVTRQTFIAAESQAYSTKEIQDIIRHSIGKRKTKIYVPVSALRMIGHIGDIIGKVHGKRFVFDSQALFKLREDAYYDGTKACSELSFRYLHSLVKNAACLTEA